MHQRCFKQLHLLVPYVYAQWLVEDEITHDYRVVASVNPPGSLSYDTAHRTGIIGQVFRLQKPLFVPDVRAHALYDPFDDSIDWELCFPVFHDGRMSAVVNLEGNGFLHLSAELWVDVCKVVESTIGLKPPTVLPEEDSSCLIETQPILIRTPNNSSESLDIVKMAKAVARGGQTVLLVGHYPDLLGGRSPTMAQAITQGLSASYCFFGVEQRLDLLATGPMIEEMLESGLEWWSNCRGRYALVLLQIPNRDTLAWGRIVQHLTEEKRTEKELDAVSIANAVSRVSGSPSEAIRQQILNALAVMFKRAIARDVDDPEIKDNKLGLPYSGTMQDCEFGMVLLAVKEWFSSWSSEAEFFLAIDRAAFERVVLGLVKRVVTQVVVRKQNQEGGEGDQLSFFTGEPYTRYEKRRVIKYSANLDAAMITLAFLALAVAEFNETLARLEHQLDVDGLPGWVRNLRDAILSVIVDGLNYAKDCRVMAENEFKGFTSDPGSNRAHPENGGLDDAHDRLFFSLTASETINDMVGWQERYLNAPTSVPPPIEAITQITSQITELSDTLEKTKVWCYERFSAEFDAFIVEDPTELVREVGSLKSARWSASLEEQVHQMELSVQHVYHFSQYATIQSLTPFHLTFNELRLIVDKLDRLVFSILNSRLDESEDEALFRTLTRQYSLGESSPFPYSDDAWYPLVVRSLSGLLSRTLHDLWRRYTRIEVQTLVSVFRRSLEFHVDNMIARRPFVEEPGDEELWSYAAGQPYVLYATQRTIFALMFYEQFRRDTEAFLADTSEQFDKRPFDPSEQLYFPPEERVPKPIKVFIAYKWEDDVHNAWVEKLATDLRKRGIDALWDKWEVRLGDSFTDYMNRISEADVFLFVMTTRSVAAIETPKPDGGAIKFEVELALARKQAGEEMRLIPIYREGPKTASYLQNHRYADFRNDSKYEENLEQLIGDLFGKARRPPLVLDPSSDKVQPAVKATDISQGVDERLVFLRDQLRRQFRQCNEFCLAFAAFRLFEPSPEARDELFEDEIIVPVNSPGGFRNFILVLHMVFDESIRNVVRRWRPGDPLPDPLTPVAEILHGERFGQLTVLRNKFAAHDAFQGDGAHAARELSHVFNNLIGVRSLARSDSAGWLKLQKAVLQMLSEVLDQVLRIFEEHLDQRARSKQRDE
jgi:hypothetical protein